MKGKSLKVLFCMLSCQLMAVTVYALNRNTFYIVFPDSLMAKDSTKNNLPYEESEEENNGLNIIDFRKLKPRLGLGLGTLTFMGDVANNYENQHLTVSRIAYDLKISNRINDYLDLSFYLLKGKVAANEHSISRNLNFKSSINTAGILLTYNFDQFLNKERWIEPYVQIGIESLEFLSKTDLYDANGNQYYYWSNGAIMNKAENDPEAYSAVVLKRDYTYESDLRKLNLDGLGNYAERTLSIPFGIGFNMKITDELNFQFGTSLHYTFTDFIDNVTHQGKNEREGNKGTDKLLFTSFSINYSIPLFKKDPLEDFPNGKSDDYYALQYGDEDNDGVIDLEDDCLGTSPYATVDKRGCAIDNDNDGVPDFRDEELDTAPNALVNENGVTLTPEQLAELEEAREKQNFKIMRSSFKGLQGTSTTVENSDPEDQYFLSIPQDESKGKEMLLLNQPDLITKTNNGNISYQIGPFSDTKDAVKRKTEMEEQGIAASAIRSADGKVINEYDENDETDLPSISTDPNQTIFRVQIGAFSKSIPLERFAGLPNVTGIRGEDGLVRYMSGAFTSLSDAANHKVQLTLKGYEEIFIVAFRNGKKISLKQAGAKFTADAGKDNTYQEPAPIVISKESIKFRVKLGAFELGVPKNIMEALFKLKNVKIMREDGASHYYYGIYDTYEEAEHALTEAMDLGVKDAFIVGDFEGKIIDANEAKRLMNE